MNISTRTEMKEYPCVTSNAYKIFFLRLLAAISLFLFSNQTATGQSIYDWYDTAPDGNWKQGLGGARWTGGLWDQPPSGGILRFNNNHQLSMTNNVGGTYSQHSIIFGSSNTSNRTIGGNTVRFYDFSGTDPKIENQSSAGHTINFNVEGDGTTDPLEMNPVSGNLTFGGTVNNQGTDILIYGNNGNQIIYNGAISGTGKFVIQQNSIARFNASNTYTGNTEINAGELWIESLGNISSSSSIFLGNGGTLGTVAKFWLSNSTGGTTFARSITVNPGNATTRYIGGFNTSGTHTFSGNITNNSSGGLYLSAEGSGGTVAFSGIIAGSNPVLTSGNATGTVIISGTSANTYSGATTIGVNTILNKTANVIALPSATTINTGITLRTDAANQWGTGTPPLVTINGTGVLNLNGNNQKIALASSSSTATVTLGSGILTIDNTASDTYAGSISGTGGLTKSNVGTFILTGACTYTGLTTVSGGILRLNKTGGTTIPAGDNVTVESGGTLQVSSNQTLNNLTVNSGGTLIIDDGITLTVTGTATYNGKVVVKSSSFSSSSTISDLEIDRTSGVSLGSDLTVNGVLTFTNGILDLNGKTLTMGSSSSFSGSSSSKYIATSGAGANGKISRAFTGNSAFTFPIGTTTHYMPVTLTNANGQTFDVKASSPAARDGVAGSGNAFSATQLLSIVDGLWNINRSFGSGTVTVDLNWPAALEGTAFSSATNTQFGISRRNGSTWEAPIQTSANNSANTASSTFSSFSPFIIARTDVSLPVTFTSLSGNIRNGKALLNWNIADEVNVDHYEVEESADGRRFMALTQVDATNRNNYQASDASLYAGANFYRVKAVDLDGKLTYSKIIRLENGSVDQQIRVYPNPTSGVVNLNLNLQAGNYQIRVINAVGQTVFQQALTHEGGSRSLPLNLPKLNAGIYQVEVRGGVEKIVKSLRIE